MEPALPLKWPPAGTRAERAALPLCLLLAATIPLRPAAAQLGGSVTLSSEARLRGRPVSEHRPVAELQLSHDSASGFYLGGSAASATTRGSGVEPLSFSGYAGIVRRVSSSAAIDLGLVHNSYTEYSSIHGGGSYSEAYAGVTGRHLSVRLFFSPGYFRRDNPTLYAEVNGNVDLGRDWTLLVHAGRLTHLREHPDRGQASDWRISVRHQIGRATLDAAWTGYAEGERTYGASGRHGNAMVTALSVAF